MKPRAFGDIFVDMDDVLADFLHHVHNTLGTPIDQRTGRLHALPYKDKIPQQPDWWAKIPVKEGAKEMMAFLKPYKPNILSAYASWDPNSISQKKLWVNKHFQSIDDKKIFLVRRSEKQNYATKNGVPNILIDDFTKNIKEWQAAGGIGVLHVGGSSSIAKLKEIGLR